MGHLEKRGLIREKSLFKKQTNSLAREGSGSKTFTVCAVHYHPVKSMR